MIADEDHERAFRSTQSGKRIALTVGASKGKISRLPADRFGVIEYY
jgi:hypothetical protein